MLCHCVFRLNCVSQSLIKRNLSKRDIQTLAGFEASNSSKSTFNSGLVGRRLVVVVVVHFSVKSAVRCLVFFREYEIVST